MGEDRTIATRWGRAIRMQRQRLGMSVAAMAEELGVSRPTIYDWEAGRAIPHAEKHVDIARVLHIHPQNLFTYPEVAA